MDKVEQLIADKAECVKALTMIREGIKTGGIVAHLSVPYVNRNGKVVEETLQGFIEETLAKVNH